MAKGIRMDTFPAYELIKRKPLATYSEPDDAFGKQSSKLPPKPLPGRRKYYPFILATAITILNIVALGLLIGYIKHLLPYTDWDGYGIQLTGTSCDLVNNQNSTRWQSAFQINLRGAAHLTFAQAKFSDLLFDLLVGQGGRLLLAAISYICFMDALLRSMEITPVSYQLYASLVFSSTSILATWQAIRAVFSTKGWRPKMYLIWCALAMIYVLAFPTLIESVTGYVSPSSAGFNLNNGQIITLDSDDLRSCFNVTNATMFGFENYNTQVLGPAAHVFDAAGPAGSTSSGLGSLKSGDVPAGVNTTDPFWILATYSSDAVYHYTFSNGSTSDNLSSKQRYRYAEYDYYYSTNITINGRMHIFNDSSPREFYEVAYCYREMTLSPSRAKFRVRGFSSIILYVILGLQLVWTVGMYCIWLDANLTSELVKSGRTIRGPFRAAADLAEALNETLGGEYCAYTDKEIEKELERSGDLLRYNSTLRDDDGTLHVGLTSQEGARVLLSRNKLYGKEVGKRRKD
ncbi:MAG: hypothetical protein Q9186_000707 [Xanthomendoza sp. 1 TL-2023]